MVKFRTTGYFLRVIQMKKQRLWQYGLNDNRGPICSLDSFSTDKQKEDSKGIAFAHKCD